MNQIELDQLGTQVDQLMRIIETLQNENAILRQKIAVNIKERARLQHKNERATRQVKQIIKQMKEELS